MQHCLHTFSWLPHSCFHLITAPSSPPLNVTAVVVNATTILVSWETPPIIHHNSPLTGYVIIYSDLSSPGGGDEMRSSIMDPTVLTALIVNLEPYSLYDVQVAAVNNAGAGPRSLEVTIETPKASQYCEYANILHGDTNRDHKTIRTCVLWNLLFIVYVALW